MGNHIAETRSAAGMSKTTLCYTGVSKERERKREEVIVVNHQFRLFLTVFLTSKTNNKKEK